MTYTVSERDYHAQLQKNRSKEAEINLHDNAAIDILIQYPLGVWRFPRDASTAAFCPSLVVVFESITSSTLYVFQSRTCGSQCRRLNPHQALRTPPTPTKNPATCQM
eukprot:GHVS01072257.1.p2 GENE.GHVS01072257.1~~GHVS01072257.1.p2  ORF type:complete len:107 (-),score=5.29 GHVS01072257.1:621-941(-)